MQLGFFCVFFFVFFRMIVLVLDIEVNKSTQKIYQVAWKKYDLTITKDLFGGAEIKQNDVFYQNFKPFRPSNIKSLIEHLNNCDLIVGHNVVHHDLKIIKRVAYNCGVRMQATEGREVCTMQAGRKYKKHRKNISLNDLYQYLFKSTFSGWHDAQNDVKATDRIFVEMLRRGDIQLQMKYA